MSDEKPQEPPVPAANGVQCHECSGFGNYYEGHVECPYDFDHATSPVYITREPLGRSDDDEVRLRSKWIYDAEEPRRD